MQRADSIRRDNTTFVLLSFEGPDQYSCVGKLGERVTHLADTLAQMGFETHLLFVGDPNAPGHEIIGGDKLHLHRWCQWISRYHPESAYQAEEAKLWDLNQSAPPFVVNDIIKKSALGGKLVIVQGEEWHSAEAISRIADLALAEGLGERVLTLWNANDVHSFSRIDWARLASKSFITTVSKYMKHLMWKMGINPLVIPNGIPRRLLLSADESRADLIRKAYEGSTLLVKFKGIDDISQAEAIRNMDICIPEAELLPLEEGEYYIDDLLGLQVVTTEGEDMGKVEDVLQSPANDVYVTDRAMIPAVKDIVVKIDLDEKKIIVKPIEGLMTGAQVSRP